MDAPHGRRLLIAAATAVAFAVCGIGARGQQHSSDALIDAVLGAYGGKVAVGAVKAYRLEGTVDAHGRGENGQVTRVVVAPAGLKVFIQYPSRSEARVVDGAAGARGTTGRDLVPVEGPLLGSMIVQAARANLPWVLDARRAQVRLAGPESGADMLELPLGEGLLLRVAIDPRSHLIVHAVGLVSAGPMEIRFQTDFSDFRKAGGVLFPFHEENYASGAHTGTTVVSRIAVNPAAAELELRAAR